MEEGNPLNGIRRWTRWIVAVGTSTLLMVGALGLGALPASAASAPKVTLNMLYMNQAGYTTKTVEAMGQQFMKLHPNVTIHFTFLPYPNMHDAIVTSAAAPKATYDVVLSDLIWTAEFGQKGYTVPLNYFIHKYLTDRNQIPKVLWNAFTYKGKIMAMPFLNNFQNFYYNKKMLAEAGFNSGPTTINQWLHQMEVLKAKHIVTYPYEDSWLQAEGLTCDYVRTAGEFGANLFTRQGKPQMNKGGALKALEFMRELVVKKLVNPASLEADEPTAANAFASGQAAFNTNWTFVTGIMQTASESKIVNQGVVSRFPIVPGTNPKTHSSSVSGYQGIAIAANIPANLKFWAWQWIQFATSQATQAKHLRSQLPVWTPVMKSAAEKKLNPWVNVYLDNNAAAYNRPMVPNYLQVSAIIQKYVHEALAGTLPVKTAANDMVQQINALPPVH